MISPLYRSTILLIALLLPSLAAGQVHEFNYDPAHSSVGFTITHLAVTKIHGRFDEVAASIKLDPNDVSTLETEVVMQVASINTAHEKRDSDLMGEDFFAVDEFPELRFTSTNVTDVAEDGSFQLHGNLTIRDVTKPIVLDAEIRGPIVQRGTQRLGFSASTQIDRFDYGLKWSALTEVGGLVAGREVKLVIEVEARRSLE